MTAPHLADWQPLSNRYGLAKRDSPYLIPGYVVPEWAARHAEPRDEPPKHGCICPGRFPGVQRATQEDFLCDECRQWCVAMDSAGNRYQLASLARAL